MFIVVFDNVYMFASLWFLSGLVQGGTWPACARILRQVSMYACMYVITMQILYLGHLHTYNYLTTLLIILNSEQSSYVNPTQAYRCPQ